MKSNFSLNFKSYKEDINDIEYFVENICNEFNISNTFYGNIFLAISEMIGVFEGLKCEGTVEFRKENKKLEFIFFNISPEIKIDLLLEFKKSDFELDNESDRSMFMVNALCDDFVIDTKNHALILTFIHEGIESTITDHRKKYLSNYLNEKVKTSQR